MTTKNIEEEVLEFHEKFVPEKISVDGYPVIGEEEVEFRLGFLDEELDEIKEAIANEDEAKILDGLVDLMWVAYGTALMLYGEDAFRRAAKEVHRANMEKVRVEGDFKIRKPAGWVEPDIQGALDDARRRFNNV